MALKDTDCALFIDEPMARLVLAWQRADRNRQDAVVINEIDTQYSPGNLADILGCSKGQARGMVKRAVALGIIVDGGEISAVAQKLVNAMTAKKLQEFRN
jgi:hypothetical protein